MPRTKKITLEEIFEKHGYIAKWEERGLEKGRKEIARKALAQGMSPSAISKITGLDVRAVKKLAGQ
jgi:hypothetical protein